MNDLHTQIEDAFRQRKRPTAVIAANELTTSEQAEAQWFEGRDWRSLTATDWSTHSDAFYAFTPDAFLYFLPSLLSVSVANPQTWLAPADSLIRMLDRSPAVENWDDFLLRRLVGLRDDEYDAISAWLLVRAEGGQGEVSESYGRAFDTVALLRQETARLRAALRTESANGAS
jgi:hypothetical protein